MLTTEDRRWLTGEKRYEGEHAKQQRYQRRRDIRERVYNSMLDLSILFDRFEPAERRKVFDPDDADGGVPGDPALTRGVRDGLAFLLHASGLTGGLDRGTVDETPAGALLDEAIREAGRKDGYLVERVDVDVVGRPADPTRIAAKLADGERLTPAELTTAIESDAVDADEIQARIRSMLLEESPTDDMGVLDGEAEQ